MDSTPPTDSTHPAPPACLARAVAGALRAEPALEAVSWRNDSPEISIATLGRVDREPLEQRVAEAVAGGREASAAHDCPLLRATGDCDSCAIPLRPDERQTLAVRRAAETTTFARITCPTAPRFWKWSRLPRIVPREIELPEDDHAINEWKPQLAAAMVCGLAMIGGHFAPPGAWPVALFLTAYLAGAWYALTEVVKKLRAGVLDIHFLMLAVAAGSALIGEWAEGAVLLFLFSLSGALEHFAMGRTQREIQALFKSAPKTANQIDAAGQEQPIAVSAIRPGLRLRVRPGELFPVDAAIRAGETASDESNLTGEATPVAKRPGDTVLAGTVNLWGSVEVVALHPAAESAHERIIRLIREAQRLKAPSQRFTDRFGSGYTRLITGLTVVMFLVWWLGLGLAPFASTEEVPSAFYRAMTLLVVASPCALVLSIPSAVLAAIAWGARRGILFRGGAAIEELATVNVVALDKTGTLTTGELAVERVESLPPGNERLIEQLACSLEAHSHHPLARAISRHARARSVELLPVTDFKSLPGSGLTGTVAGRTVRLGKRSAVTPGDAPASGSEPEPELSEVWVTNGVVTGRLVLRDELRPQAAAVTNALRQAGLRTVVLTGDRQSVADRLAAKVVVDEVRAGLKPEDKLAAIRELSTGGRRVVMVGDGVNDAPSLAAAHVGVAMGARGSDAALEQAAVILMRDRLENFLAAWQLSRRARAVIRQNLVLSLGTVVLLVVIALAGRLPLAAGVLGHEGSTVLVVLNGLRLLFSHAAPGRGELGD